MTQAQVAEHLGITPRAYAFWERDPVALKADQLAALAKLFEVSADYLIGRETPRQRRNGPVGRARRAFEMVSELPRSQQQRILDVVEDMITAQRVSKRKKRRDRSSVV